MIVCKQCGHHNEDSDTFCGSCGKFLEWTGERVAVAEPEPEPVAAEPEPEPAKLGLIDRVKHAVGIEETGAPPPPPAQPEPAPAPVAAPASVSAAPVPAAAVAPPAPPPVVWSVPVTSAAPPAPPVQATAPPPAPVLAGVGAPVAAAPPPTVAPADEPMSRRPISVAPTVARPRSGPRTLEAPTRRHPGDLICGQCGEGNDPVRHFCRRCGNSLDEALAVRLPWYRRFFNRVFGIRTREAGWRPHRVGPPNVLGVVWRIIRLAIVALIVVALVAFLLVPGFHNLVVDRATAAFTAIRKVVHPNYEPVTPIGASASTSIAGHAPMLAIDGYKNTYWAALASDRAPVLVVRFSGQQDIGAIVFRSGSSGSAPADAANLQPRPRVIHLVFSNGYATDVTLNDDTTQTQSTLLEDGKAKQVTFVEIHVQSFYAPAAASASSVAITEVEFKAKN
ncbi:MAG TPA: hypothetical protein VN973_06670 [Candidatus Dormibacteraeota bacterium]|nr:hypothetical protein [Candidatus Dormibacteraeota bacterium]